MKLEFESAAELKRRLKEVLGHYIDLKTHKVFVFGSRVTGNCSPRADIDVGVLGPAAVPAEVWSDLLEAVENLPYLYTIDLVDFNRVGPEFKKLALKQIEEL